MHSIRRYALWKKYYVKRYLSERYVIYQLIWKRPTVILSPDKVRGNVTRAQHHTYTSCARTTRVRTGVPARHAKSEGFILAPTAHAPEHIATAAAAVRAPCVHLSRCESLAISRRKYLQTTINRVNTYTHARTHSNTLPKTLRYMAV